MELIHRRVSEPTANVEHIYTKVGNKLRKVPLDDILYIEVEGSTVRLQVRDRKYNVKASLKDLFKSCRPTASFGCHETSWSISAASSTLTRSNTRSKWVTWKFPSAEPTKRS